MAFLVTYCIVGGTIAFGLYYFLYRRTEKKPGMVQQSSFVVKAPLVFGWINALLGAAFLLYYTIAPAAFSPDTTFSSLLALVMMTIFSSYFYYLAMPVSIGSLGISILEYKKDQIAVKRFWLVLLLNSIGTLTIAFLSYQLFG